MLRRQQGTASFIFMMFLPVLIVFLVFTIQVSQQFQAHAKLTEATEVASLALVSTSTGRNRPQINLAKRIVKQYMPDDLPEFEIDVQAKTCLYTDGCVREHRELSSFSDYTITAKTKHSFWMNYEGVFSEPTFNVVGTSTSRKYLPQPQDVYFVVDMSQSMSYSYGDDRSITRIDVVKETIGKVLHDLQRFNKYNKVKSRVAFIGYHHMSIRKINGERVVFSHVVNGSIKKTVDNMFDSNKPAYFFQNVSSKLFNDIPLTDDYDKFKMELDSFSILAPAQTQSWQGLIRAAQVTNEVKKYNPEQVIIVLSDGADNNYYDPVTRAKTPNFLKKLVKSGLCKNIVNNLDKKRSRFGNKLKVTFGVIGIDFLLDRSSNGFFDCVGEEKVFHAKQGSDVYKYILNLLNEETGRLINAND